MQNSDFQSHRWRQLKTVLPPLVILLIIIATGYGWIVTYAQSETETPSAPVTSTVTTTIYLPLVQSDPTVQASAAVLQNIPRLGLIYSGLELDATGACNSLLRVSGTNYCTHGPDLPPPGIDITQNTAPLPLPVAESAEISAALCDGDGVSGNRVQVLYVRASDRADRYSQYLASIRQWANDVDQIYYNSAVETGGVRHVRFVHNAACEVIVNNVVISSAADDDFAATISAVQTQGYNRSDRKYMMFVDANVYCGIGGIWDDDRPQQSNRNNFGPSYGRNDNGCWNGYTAAHELGHNLGAVQRSAPNSTNRQNSTHPNTWHCSDEYDIMCYADAPGVQVFVRCANSSQENRLDCNHDDYYHTNPPAGNYLATHWNVANNQFLNSLTGPIETDPRTIVSGQTLNGTIDPAADQDTYYFDITKPQLATIRMNRTNTSLDSYLILYAPNGSEVTRDDDSGGNGNAFINQATLTQSGRYRILASSFTGGSTGGYTISLELGANCTPAVNGVVLYEQANYGGQCITLTGNDVDLADNSFNDIASSLRFVGTYATGWEAVVYEHSNYGGLFSTFRANDPDLGNDTIGNDRASAIVIRRVTNNNFALNRPAFATTQNSAKNIPAKGNDGNIKTSWASKNNAAGDQWWWVDMGQNQTFDNVTVRWQAAYAASYFIGWSNNGINFTGYWFSLNAAGNYNHTLGTQNARYVGILMRTRAPRKKNYSFSELEVYRTPARATTGAEQMALATTALIPTGELFTITPAQSLLAVMAEQATVTATAAATTDTIVAAAIVQPGASNLLTGNSGGLSVSAQLPVNSTNKPITARLTSTDTQTMPDGHALVGDMFTVRLATTDGTAVKTLEAPIQLTIDYAAVSATMDQAADLSLQAWNAETESWEIVPATVNDADHTITALLKQSTTLAVWQKESGQTNLFYLPNVQR